ncbi:MAG: helix-turn-helix transcriptional regulator [Elusimicrobia bacterium]|nr:helix-turn-helix transcriptional regulator [Elusimicrobiota bacterium]
MDNLQKIIGSRIKEFRRQRELIQEELADKSGLHPTFIAHIEGGRKVCSIKSLQKIASALNVPVDSLLRQKEEKTKNLYDLHTEKLIQLIRDKTDGQKTLLYSLATSLFSKNKRKK